MYQMLVNEQVRIASILSGVDALIESTQEDNCEDGEAQERPDARVDDSGHRTHKI